MAGSQRNLSDLIRTQASEPPSQPAAGSPKYARLARKEARLHPEQLDRLTELARQLNRQKRGGERITENTLIRVAVALLLTRSAELQGDSEVALRQALDLDP